MRGILGLVAVFAVLGGAIYLAFINPSYKMSVNDSITYTQSCVENDNALSVDSEGTRALSGGLGFGRVVAIDYGAEKAAIFITPSESQAMEAVRELRQGLPEVYRKANVALSQAQLSATDLPSLQRGICLLAEPHETRSVFGGAAGDR